MTQACVVYSRFSPRRNAEESVSCDTQDEQCRELATARGWAVRSFHRDEGVSGKDEVDRPGLDAAITALHKGDVLLVYNRDRLARSVLLAELIMRQVKASGARIVAVDGDVAEDDSPETVFVRQVMNAVAELERKRISARTSRSMRTQQRQGKRMGRYPPYGWRFDPEEPGQLLPDEREQEGVALVKEAAKADGMTPWKVARHMTKKFPELARGKKWKAATVEKILERKIL